MMFVGTHKNKKKKKKVEEIIGNKRSRVGTNRRWLKMTLTDKEKIEKALDHIDHFLAYRDKVKGSKRLPILRSDITNIKSILETGKLPDYGFDET